LRARGMQTDVYTSTILNIIYLNKLKSPSRARHFVAPCAAVAWHPFRGPVASRRLSNPRRSLYSGLRKPPRSVPLNPIVPRFVRFTPLRILYKPEDATRCHTQTLFSIYVQSRQKTSATFSQSFLLFKSISY